MKRRPYFKLWVDDFDTDERARSLPLELQGAYLWLLRHQWREGSIPADPERVLRLLPVRGDAEAARVREGLAQVLECFRELEGDPARLVNPRLEAERADAARCEEAQRCRGKLSALARQRGKRTSRGSDVELERRRQVLLVRLRGHMAHPPPEPESNAGSTVVQPRFNHG